MTVALSDIRLAAQQRCDRQNAPVPSTSEWNTYINGSLGRLYALLTSTYEDYNVKTYSFSLPGGVGGNTLSVGYNTAVPDFDKARKLSKQVGTNYYPVTRADSFMNFDELTAPAIATYYGAYVAVKYMLYGNTLEVRPVASAAGSYLLYYVPSFQPLVNDTDVIDGTWMATNGIHEYAILDSAAKAMVREESLDTAMLLMKERDALKVDILAQFAQRDDNQPGRIADVKRIRSGSGFGWNGGLV